jgi:hypothetical protein
MQKKSTLTCLAGAMGVCIWGLRGGWLFNFCACSCSFANFCFSSSVSEALKQNKTTTKINWQLHNSFCKKSSSLVKYFTGKQTTPELVIVIAKLYL